MAKHLRIDIAELTDIGRRRSNNQDNVATQVPEDQREMDRAGALFVVADGMGGHAAGEIASTVAVQTITTAYSSVFQEDVLEALDRAVKQANEAILTIAHENADHLGMGTTLVVAVVNQGLLYIANIGDSRAYLMRDGTLRQVTNDHSWVAEQVRAGILTEEQARNHVHRNVITRSLGTQPEVRADVFIEPLQEGDVVLLCSDGLHGYVDDATIKEVAEQHPPEKAVKLLVDAANEAGGPDNITVIIARVNETPQVSASLLERLQKVERQRRETTPLTLMPLSKRREQVEAPAPPAAVADEEILARVPTTLPRRRRGRVAILALAAAVLLAVLSGAAWYTIGPLASGNYTQSIVSMDLHNAQSDINHLSSSSLSLADQLKRLATDQRILWNDLHRSNLTANERTQIQDFLDHQLTTASQATLQAYEADATAKITPLMKAQPQRYLLTCSSLLSPLVMLPAPAAAPGGGLTLPQFFALTPDRYIRQINLMGSTANCGNIILPQVKVDAMVADGDHLDILTPPPPDAASQAPSIFDLNPDGTTKLVTTIGSFDTTLQPRALAMGGKGTEYAVLGSATSPNGGDIIYLLNSANFAMPIPFTGFQAPGALTPHVRSIAIGANHLLYMLLDTGQLATCDMMGNNYHIIGGLTISPALPIDNLDTFNAQTPIPTVAPPEVGIAAPIESAPASSSQAVTPPLGTPTTGAATTPSPSPPPTATPVPTPTPRPGVSTLLTTATSIAISADLLPPHLAIADARDHRVIVLTGNTGIDLDLSQQYTDLTALSSLVSVGISADGGTLALLTSTEVITISLPT